MLGAVRKGQHAHPSGDQLSRSVRSNCNPLGRESGTPQYRNRAQGLVYV